MPKGSITPVSEIKKHLEQFKISNQKISDYCRSHNIASSTFHGWNKRFNISNKSFSKLTKKDLKIFLNNTLTIIYVGELIFYYIIPVSVCIISDSFSRCFLSTTF